MTTKNAKTTKASATIRKIAGDILGIETLETRKSDRLDFHDLAVWQIQKALEAAYEAGKAAGRTSTNCK